ncbi:MAG TPA: PIN domain-containing protein [Pirellulales bacterium]|nr:PIN domain-containing protein [Pirellulales bacterium]
MRILLDTNILVRLADVSSPHHEIASEAVDRIEADDHELCVVPQIAYEFWVVVTRPVSDNGLGLSSVAAEESVESWKSIFTMLLDERGVYSNWRDLVRQTGVIGKRAHDARLVAAMLRHGLTHILTFNAQHFRQFGKVQILEPSAVARTGI